MCGRRGELKLEFDKACNSQWNQSVITLSNKSYEKHVCKETEVEITFALVGNFI